MQEYVTVSAKIPKTVRKRMKRLGIRPSVVFRIGLEEELKREQVATLKKKAEKLRGVFARISDEDIVRSIREDRDSR